MNILLISPLSRDFMPPSMPPLGLAYVAAALRENGHKISVVDLDAERENGKERLVHLLKGQAFDLIGISSIITQFKKVEELSALVKSLAPETILIAGGPGPTSIPKLYLTHCPIDIVIIGEGERTMVEVASLIEKKAGLDSCDGISYKSPDGEMNTTKLRVLIEDVNQVSFPAWDLVPNVGVYAQNFLFKGKKASGMCIMSTRGCPGECNYCMCNFGRKVRMRSTGNIAQEIELLIQNYNIEHVHFLDDTFITIPKRVEEVCALFKKKFPFLTWSANVRANLVTKDMLKYMAKANCVFLAYGIESGSPEVLKYMKKGFSVEQARNAIQWTKEAEISLRAYFIMGMPVETKETFRETVDFCKENLVGGEFFFATPIPGTELYEHALSRGLIKDEYVYVGLLGEVRNFLVNLTNIPTEELFEMKEKAEKEIKAHLIENNMEVPRSTRIDPRETLASLPDF